MSNSEPYILNQVQTPNGLFPVYYSLKQEEQTKEEVARDTGLPESSVDEVLGGLRLLRMIETTDFIHSAVEPTWNTGDPMQDFQLTALENLAEQATEDEWGKQAVVLLNYEYLISENRQQFENDEEALYKNIDNWITDKFDYRPKDGAEIYTHNSNKFGNWTRLIHYLGLTHKVEGREHAVYPEPELILSTIKRAATESRHSPDADADVGIREYSTWLHEHVIRHGSPEEGDVPAVISRSLAILARRDEIALIEYGDAGSVTLTDVPMSGHRNIDTAANSISLT